MNTTVVPQAGVPTPPLKTFLGPAKPPESRMCTRGQVLHDPGKCVSSNFVHVQHITVSVQSSGNRTTTTTTVRATVHPVEVELLLYNNSTVRTLSLLRNTSRPHINTAPIAADLYDENGAIQARQSTRSK